MHLTFRDARADDAAELTDVARAAKQSWGYPDEWMVAWSATLAFDAETIAAMRILLVEDERGVAGFFGLEGAGESVRLEHLWVRPDRMGEGLGRALFERAVDEAATSGARELVIESDPYAEPFYLRMGAARVGSVPAPAPGAPDRALPLLRLEIPRAAPSS